MRRMVFSLVAAAALLASVGAADAKEPVQLTDAQLDKATAGDVPTAASLLAASTAELNALLALSNFLLNPLSAFPATGLTGLTATP